MGVLSRLFTKQDPQADEDLAVVVSSELRVYEPGSQDGDGDYANREDYEHPVLTLRPWDYGHGLEPTARGYGFTAPDGKIWAAHNCLWSTWKDLGVLVINTVGTSYHLDDLADPSFDPGRPLRLFPEPENPYDPKAMAIRNWACDKTAGYVKRGSTARLRNLLRGEDLRVMALSCRYDQPPPRGRRESLHVVIFRPDRVLGAEHVPPHPRLFDKD
jgi:HIRAN domain